MAELVEGTQATDVEMRTLRRGGADVTVVHARCEGMPRAGIVLHPDIMGVRDLFVDLSRRIASHGFAVACVEPFARVPEADRAATVADAGARMSWPAGLDDDEQLGDLDAAANLLTVEDDVASVGVLGFCMGGFYTFKAAATERFDAAVACYGMLAVPEGWRGPGQRAPIETAGDVCPTLAIFGSADPWTPLAEIEALRVAWAGRGDCEIVVVEGADHGFIHAPERPAHRADDAARLWPKILGWIGG